MFSFEMAMDLTEPEVGSLAMNEWIRVRVSGLEKS